MRGWAAAAAAAGLRQLRHLLSLGLNLRFLTLNCKPLLGNFCSRCQTREDGSGWVMAALVRFRAAGMTFRLCQQRCVALREEDASDAQWCTRRRNERNKPGSMEAPGSVACWLSGGGLAAANATRLPFERCTSRALSLLVAKVRPGVLQEAALGLRNLRRVCEKNSPWKAARARFMALPGVRVHSNVPASVPGSRPCQSGFG